MWDETYAQNDGTIEKRIHFPLSSIEMIYLGPNIGVANPYLKTCRRTVNSSSDYDNIDLLTINGDYWQRSLYSVSCPLDDYISKIPESPFGKKHNSYYRLAMRKMLNLTQERTLMSAIVPPQTAHVLGVFSIAFIDDYDMLTFSGECFSIPIDFLVKIMGKSNILRDTAGKLPLLRKSVFTDEIIARTLLLNCLTKPYAELWKQGKEFCDFTWGKEETRLKIDFYQGLGKEWTVESPLRSDFERRQALVEIDVLVAMALGMTLEQLKTIYRIQFPVLQSYEKDTWYDANGRITFSAKSYGDLTYKRPEFENPNVVTPIRRSDAPWDGIMKHAPAGYVFVRTITDDTMPGGPIERTIEYHAPFDRCDREQDYETAWKFFEEKYGKER